MELPTDIIQLTLSVIGLFALIYKCTQLIIFRNNRNTEDPTEIQNRNIRQDSKKENQNLIVTEVTKKEQIHCQSLVHSRTAIQNASVCSKSIKKNSASYPKINKKRGIPNPRTAMSFAVRKNIGLIERDLMICESFLVDAFQNTGIFSEDDIQTMKRSSRKDQAHLFAEKVEDFDDRTFLEILDILRKHSHGHISEEMNKSYQEYLPGQLADTLCPYCRIINTVDIKSIRCGLIENELLPKKLWRNINKCSTGRGDQLPLWEALFRHLKSEKPEQKIVEKFIKVFNKPEHRYIFPHLSADRLYRFKCTCNRQEPSLEIDYFRAPLRSICYSKEESFTFENVEHVIENSRVATKRNKRKSAKAKSKNKKKKESALTTQQYREAERVTSTMSTVCWTTRVSFSSVMRERGPPKRHQAFAFVCKQSATIQF